MELFQIILWALSVALVASDDSCPAPTEISPCTCDGEGLNCMGARTLEEIRRAFNAKFKYGGVRSVWVQGTPLTDLPGDLFGKVRSHSFFVEVNNLTSLNFNAFSASEDTMRLLSLFGNKLDTLDYSGLTQYSRIELLNLGRNKISSIPDSAFNSKTLRTLILAQNQISNIGMNAFAGLTSIEKLELSMNRLTTLGPLSIATKQTNVNLLINFAGNQISSVSSTAFEGTTPYGLYMSQNRLTSLPKDSFSNLITRIAQKGGFMEVSSNPFDCSGCDYSWLVLNKDILNTRLIGFTCKDGRSLQDLTKSNIQCE